MAKAPESGTTVRRRAVAKKWHNVKARPAPYEGEELNNVGSQQSAAVARLAENCSLSAPIVGSSNSSAMDAAYERPASTSSYFARPPPPSRLLLRVYSAECLRHVSSHGTYCKIYVGSTEMVRGSGAFARRSQKLKPSASTHSLGGLLHSSRGNTAQPPTTPLPPTSSSEGDLSGPSSKMRVLKTQVQKGKRPDPVWNEKFDIPVLDPNEDVLSIRVKSARLMSSPAIGACSIPLKYLTMQGSSTTDRWVDLKLGKKDAGRIRLQLRLVASSRQRNQQNSDTHLSLPAEETPEQIAARNKTLRRDHKYHRSARHFDGRPVTSSVLGSSSGSNKSASDKDDDQKRVPSTPTTLRDNSASATSNESIDDSEPASDVSVSPVASPLHKRASKEDDSKSTAVTRQPRESFDSFAETPDTSIPSPAVAPSTKDLDASYAHRGTMRRSELERSKMKMTEISRTSRISRSSRSSRSASSQVHLEDDDFDDLDEYDNTSAATKRWTGNHTKLSVLSSLDPRESSRMDFDDDIEYERDTLDKRKTSVHNGSSSIALSSTASSTLDPRGSSRFSFSDSDSDGEVEEDDEVKSEKVREQQRQQWQMEQRKMQLARIKEVSQSMSDDDSDEDSEDDDECDEELEQERASTRIQFTPALANLLGRESMNVLFEDEDEDEEEEEESPEPYKMSEEFVPILEASSPMSVDSVDCALRRSSFD
ncbi:hypothetical protein F441_12472 [Phytophthora nicotianae CJ01A1]|uniref:C2 domain-containing protein n=2 Tax=Phytophthora nicotianae TaxID=4792 RepID=W2WP21_PHYNI|nr:hypothetical protein L916_12144 [Phytophthora nicotianae]ETP12097.1 hypothetical protein F441_12472 [Phytophthora nicotianae CJ01A1]